MNQITLAETKNTITNMQKSLKKRESILNKFLSQLEPQSDFYGGSMAVSYSRQKQLITVSREISRLQKEGLELMKFMHQINKPQLQVNIKTDTAFIAQNQQNISQDKKIIDPR